MRRSLVFCCLLAACTAEPTNGLPVGESTWSGTGDVGPFTFLLDVTLDNQAGDISGSVSIADSPDAPAGIGSGTYTITGTHDPASGALAVAPNTWVVEPDVQVELLGFVGIYDPETGELSGDLVDYASVVDNTQQAEGATLSLASGDGEPLAVGEDLAALPVAESVTFRGTYTCTSIEREVLTELTYDGAGGVSGSLSYGDATLAEDTYTFTVTGVHNPTTGGLTLAPGLYTTSGDGTFLAFFLDGTVDASAGSFVADGRTNVGPCPTAESWDTSR